MQYGFGVDLGGTATKIAFFDKTGNLLAKWEIPTRTENSGAQILPDISASVRTFLQQQGIAQADIFGIGIGVPGAADPQGVVSACDNLGWGKTDVRRQLQDLTGLPVRVGNDANLAALGECWKGSGCDNMVLVTLGTGVGGGIIINGKPLCGMTGAAGEIGHLVLNRNEPLLCNCGKRGCAEQYCSATGIVRLTEEYLEKNPAASLLRQENPLTCKAVFDAAGQGDRAAQAILEQVYAYTAELIANVCIMLNPEKVVIGGGVSKAGQPLLDGIRRHFDKFIYHASAGVEFSLASLGNDAGAYGAFKLLVD